MDDLSGQVIKGYELRELVGAGGFGAVYRAYQPLLEREVAIKVILPQHANRPDFIRRFEAEAQLVARLEHLHIVPLHDYWREPDGAFLVMRWLRGGSLRDSLQNGPWMLEAAARLTSQIAAALTVAHRHGVVHRDIKPANILLDEEGNAYLADFGIAKSPDTDAFDKTQAGEWKGTMAYASPEQASGDTVTALSDLYSLGIVLFEVLTGQHPFPDAPANQLFHPLPSLQDFNPDLPSALDDVIQKAAANDLSERYADALTLATAFRHAVLGEAPTTRDEEVTAPDGVVPDMVETGAFIDLVALEVENPYKGLRAFQEADAADFFGREALVEQLLARLSEEEDETTRFLAVVGPSGSGKSSVVKAGLIPALRQDALLGSGDWFIVDMLPGSRPFEELEIALLRIAADKSLNLMEHLRRDERGLLRAARLALPDDESQLLLVIDQFEETFTLIEDENTRAHFLDSLLTAVTEPRSPLRVVITLRADFYDRPLLYPGFGELVRKRMETVMPLSPDEIEQAIIGPAERVGVTPDPGLVAAITNDVGEQPGALPLLQYALTELFERREGHILTLDAYHASGGVLGALARRADELYERLDAEGQETARQLFLRLITLGEGTENTRRRVRRAELVFLDDEAGTLETVLGAYGEARLLTFDRDPVTRGPTVEVAHEALIRQWGRLREWVNASREDMHLHRRLTAEVSEWVDAGHDPGFLASGARLDQYEAWAEMTDLALNEDETEYLKASIADREARRARDEARKEHEAMLVMQSRNRLRYLVVVLFLATLGGLILSLFAFDREGQAQDNAATATHALGQEEAARATSEANAAIASTNEADAEVNLNEAWNTQALFLADLSRQELEDGSPQNALLLALESLAHYDDGIYNSESGTALLNALRSPVQEVAHLRHEDNVNGAIWNMDGNRVLSWSKDGTVRVLDIAGEEELLILRHEGEVLGAKWNIDETRILSWSQDGSVRVWDAESGAELLILRHESYVYGAAWNFDETRILSWSGEYLRSPGIVRVWDAESGEVLFTLQHGSGVGGAAWNRDESRILSWSRDLTARVWDAESGEELLLLRHESFVDGATWNADETRILSWPRDGSVRMWDATSGEELLILRHEDWVDGATWNADETRILSWSRDGSVWMWDATSGEELLTLRHEDWVVGAKWSRNSSHLLTWSYDGVVRIWSVDGTELRVFNHDSDPFATPNAGAVWNDDETQLITWSNDGTIRVWDAFREHIAAQILYHELRVQGATWNRDESRILSWSGDYLGSPGMVRVWDATSGEEILTLHHENRVNGAAWNRDETRILSWSQDGSVRVWDATSGEEILTLHHENGVSSAAWNRDETRILSRANTVQMWDVTSGEEILTLHHENGISGAAWNRDESRILSYGGLPSMVRVWDATSGEEILILHHLEEYVHNAVWNWDETRILSWSRDGGNGSVRVWDATSGEELLLLHHEGDARGAQWNTDETRILSWSQDGSVRVWDATSGEELLLLRLHGAVEGAKWNDQESRILSWSNSPYGCETTCLYEIRVWDVVSGSVLFKLHLEGPIHDAEWNGDESRIVSRSGDNTVRVWDAQSGEELLTLRHDDYVLGATWNADETRILSWSQDGSVRMWTVDTAELIEIGRSSVIREFSNLERDHFFLPTLELSPTNFVPSITPLPTLTPSSTPTATPTVNLTSMTATLTPRFPTVTPTTDPTIALMLTSTANYTSTAQAPSPSPRPALNEEMRTVIAETQSVTMTQEAINIAATVSALTPSTTPLQTPSPSSDS